MLQIREYGHLIQSSKSKLFDDAKTMRFFEEKTPNLKKIAISYQSVIEGMKGQDSFHTHTPVILNQYISLIVFIDTNDCDDLY